MLRRRDLSLASIVCSAAASGRVSDERKIPWAPRVALEQREVAVFLEPRECGLDVSLEFSVLNFRLQTDGDVLYRFTDPESSAQVGRGHIVCGQEGMTSYGKPIFNCSLHLRFRSP
eukprot:CAMPEP_0114168770 /NCGR_PEP_ID=MMETSP0043_2-20121206/33183_1 /TAXON_ID=464988 /ORGANISM="Hemiselmis andersenii, Strain CCMP644" /LENGTH=115 /DNA_ID=CAMNT_0001266129 /DNA_START=171 /DNA_END=515 /DNA_ORIENTATION=-